MIVKAHEPVRQLDFRHMTTGALAGCDRTSLSIRVTGGSDRHVLRRMTRQALSVVGSFVPREVLMRVMACYAADAGIGAIETLAACQPVRLKAYIDFSSPLAANYGLPRAMTLTAEIRDVLRSQPFQIGRRSFQGLPLDR